jgi:hypothetical protein
MNLQDNGASFNFNLIKKSYATFCEFEQQIFERSIWKQDGAGR